MMTKSSQQLKILAYLEQLTFRQTSQEQYRRRFEQTGLSDKVKFLWTEIIRKAKEAEGLTRIIHCSVIIRRDDKSASLLRYPLS